MGISSMWASNQWNRWNRFDFNEDSNLTPDRKLKRSKKYHKRIFALSCIFFRYQEEGRKYGIELVEKKDFEGSRLIVTSLSRLIIRETNSNDTGGFFFKTPCLEIICCSGWYNCTQTASQPPQNQSHYLEVKGPTHSHQNFPRARQVWDHRNLGPKTPRPRKELRTQDLMFFHWQRCQGWVITRFCRIIEERIVLRFGGQKGMRARPSRTTKIWG